MRTLIAIVITCLSVLFTLPALADDMVGMSHAGNMDNMPGMQHAAAPVEYHSQGIVKRWENQRIAIAHHAVPALNWPPMTMTFAVPAALDGQKLAAGTPVDFSFRQDTGGFVLTAIHTVQP